MKRYSSGIEGTWRRRAFRPRPWLGRWVWCSAVAAFLLGARLWNANAQALFAVTNNAGEEIVLASGLTNAWDFQWSRLTNGLLIQLTNSDRITGADEATLRIADAALSDTGTYYLTATDNGLPTNLTFVVYVTAAPVVEKLDFFIVDNVVTFQVEATGGLLCYQWCWQGQEIAGATRSTLTFANADSTANAGYYTVRVSNRVDVAFSPPPGILFTKPTPAGTYQGLFFEETNTALESSGWFRFTLSASKRTFSGKLTITNSVYPFSGAFTPAHDGLVNIEPKGGGSPFTLRLQMLTTDNSPQVVGTISHEFWTVPLRGNRLAMGGASPSPLAGKYTLSFQNTNLSFGAQRPSGNGYGAVTVTPKGKVVLKGKAADGTSVAHSCSLSKGGAWPLYTSLYKNRGCLVGWLTVGSASAGNIQGRPVSWIKHAFADKRYSGGFTNVQQPKGSAYTGTRKTQVIPFTNGVAVVTGGDLLTTNGLPVWDFIKVSLPQTNRFVAEEGPEGLKLSVHVGSGVISGQFTDLMTGRRARIEGVVLQQQRSVLGYFLSTNSAGYFGITAAP